MSSRLKKDTPLSDIKGIGPKASEKFGRLGLETVGDLLRHTPVRYEDWSKPMPISKMKAGDYVIFRGTVEKAFQRRAWRRGFSMMEVRLKDATGTISLVWFNQPYVRYGFSEGQEIVGSGKVSFGKRSLTIPNPTYETVSEISDFGIMPVYRRTTGLSSKSIWTAIKKILPITEPIEEFIPHKVREIESLPEVNESLRALHIPINIREAERARRRFAFEDLFMVQLINLIEKKKLLSMESPVIESDIGFAKEIMSSLPFSLTFSQKRSLWEIMKDMGSGRPMNRLLQGDVGSGKTVVSAIAALMAAKHGCQTALMAPTEILAEQHYSTLIRLFGSLEYPIALVTGKETSVFYGPGLESSVKRKDILEDIKKGKIRIVIGTHALIAESKSSAIEFGELGLVIVDEQHRFGVKARGKILKKSGLDSHKVPHFLSMSATPIPRTLAISIFGDLDLSVIDELPKERKPIVTRIVPPSSREKAYDFVRKEILEGRQAFIVCPRIEKNDDEEVISSNSSNEAKTVKEEFERLSKKIFPDLKVVMLHGKMKTGEKAGVMDDFRDGKTDILVATSVIEVGVDIPNASVMMIESADRFGLAQLYQFKGRVGRGPHKSYCLLLSESPSESAINRLKVVVEAKSGFELAEKDLALRGPGEFLGDSQTGTPDLTMIALQDPSIIRGTRRAAEAVVEGEIRFDEFSPLEKRLDKLRGEFHFE
ncbi:MAG: ATP-dependent DNA helicase RecG [Candidatus Colwellbacteria bacterium]|nr:ATP-dependent DNA helicase RecG [Candidatus Colwellbacteria bacterium]